MALDTLDKIAAAMPGQPRDFIKASASTGAAGNYLSLFKISGYPAASTILGGTPGINGEIPTSASAGAFPFDNPTSGLASYIGKLAASSSVAGKLIIYDRLWHNSNINLNVNTAQAITPPALTRPDSNGANTELWLEILSASGVTQATATVTYTNSSGTAGQSGSVTIAASTGASRILPVTLATGDTGVRAVSAIQLSLATGGGQGSLAIMRRVAEIPLIVGAVNLNALDLALPRIYDSACLFMVVHAGSTTTGAIDGSLTIIQG